MEIKATIKTKLDGMETLFRKLERVNELAVEMKSLAEELKTTTIIVSPEIIVQDLTESLVHNEDKRYDLHEH